MKKKTTKPAKRLVPLHQSDIELVIWMAESAANPIVRSVYDYFRGYSLASVFRLLAVAWNHSSAKQRELSMGHYLFNDVHNHFAAKIEIRPPDARK